MGHEMPWGGMAKWVECSASHTTELGGGGCQQVLFYTQEAAPIPKDTKIGKLPLPGTTALGKLS